jgi:hypothetical protein
MRGGKTRSMSMNFVRWAILMVVVAAALSLGTRAMADDAAKTVTGNTSCGGCSGVVKGCCVMLTDKDGVRWILRGDSDSLKAAFKDRHDGKPRTAILSAEPVTKKDKEGKEYKEVKVSEIKAGS